MRQLALFLLALAILLPLSLVAFIALLSGLAPRRSRSTSGFAMSIESARAARELCRRG